MDLSPFLDEKMLGTAAAMGVLATPLFRAAYYALVAVAQDKRTALAINQVSRVALIGASAATKHYLIEILKARDPMSPGGTRVTPEERKQAVSVGVGAAWTSLQSLGPKAVREIVKLYGGETQVLQSIEVMILRRLGVRVDELEQARVAEDSEPRA